MADPERTEAGDRVAVLVVDDEPELRMLFQLLFEADGRFEVVGEATDGVEGVELAESLQPDVVLLDKSMPRMSGLEALPRIREVAPHTVVVLYTAESDEQVHQAAIAAGALDVLTKGASVTNLAGMLTDVLLRPWSDPATNGLDVQIGPVPSDSALEWIENTLKILDAVQGAPEVTDVEIDPAVFETFRQYLCSWREVAQANRDFVWAARAAPNEVEGLIEAWASIDRIDEEELRALGCEWSSAKGRMFFDTLTTGVLGALERHQALASLAERLRTQWKPDGEGVQA